MNIASMISRYNRYQKRKSVISSDDSLISASDLSKEWGLSYIATCEEIKRLRIPLAFNIANEKFYDRETCNKKMPFLSECKIIKPEKKEVESMDKNEELQKWLNDDRYVQKSQLMDVWGISFEGVNKIFRVHRIKRKHHIIISGKHYTFFSKEECQQARPFTFKIDQLKHMNQCIANVDLISNKELAKKWNTSVMKAGVICTRANIQIVEKFNLGGKDGIVVFYNKAECEKIIPDARCVEDSAGLVTTGFLCNQWNMSAPHVNIFLKKNNITSKGLEKKKNGERRGRAAHLYDFRECLIAMQKYKTSEHELKKYCDNFKYTQRKELERLWHMTRGQVNVFLQERGIQPLVRFATNKGFYAYYDRAECERARPFINQPEQKEVEKVENIGELATATKHQILCETGADDFVWDKVTMKHKIMPVKNYCDERGNFVSLFNKNESVSAILEYKNEQKQLLEKCLADKNLVTTTDLAKIWNTNKKSIYNKIYRLKIKPHAKVKLENGNIWHFYKRSDCIESQEVEKVKQVNLPEPKEQMPDIIPADTIDLFTMSELESELNKRGVELTDEVKAKINASDMPEMQEIATMIRGNAKTIAIRLSVLNEIAGQLKSVKKLSFYEKVLAIGKNKTEKEEPKKIPVDFFPKSGNNGVFYLDKELKPCPFCGMDSIMIDCEEISTGYWLARLQCSNCEVKLELDDSTKEIAADLLINQWNERPHNEDCAKTKAGAKSKYKPEFDKIAFDMASANKTDIEICEQLNISTETFYRYKKEIESFADAIDRGRSANPFIITDSQGREKADRYFELKDFMEMQKQLNDMQKMIEKLVKKLDGVNMTEKKMFVKNGKIDKVVVTETKLEDKK